MKSESHVTLHAVEQQRCRGKCPRTPRRALAMFTAFAWWGTIWCTNVADGDASLRKVRMWSFIKQSMA